MKNKKLEKLFLDYLTQLAQNAIEMQIKEDEEMWLLFGEEDIHINKINNTLYVKPIDILIENVFQEDKVVDNNVQWVAYQKNILTLDHRMTIGTGNPFNNKTLSSFNHHNKLVVKAIPYQYAIKMHKQDKNK